MGKAVHDEAEVFFGRHAVRRWPETEPAAGAALAAADVDVHGRRGSASLRMSLRRPGGIRGGSGGSGADDAGVDTTGAYVIEQCLSHAVDHPRIALNALLELAEVLQRDVVRLNRRLDGEIVVVLERRVDAEVEFQLVRGDLGVFGFLDLLGAAAVGEVPYRHRAESGDDKGGHQDAPQGTPNDQGHGTGAFVAVCAWRTLTAGTDI